MMNYIAAGAAKTVIATVISAVCFGAGAVPCFATTAAPAVASAAAHTTGKVVPDDSPWP
jgi:hypothetical protein